MTSSMSSWRVLQCPWSECVLALGGWGALCANLVRLIDGSPVPLLFLILCLLRLSITGTECCGPLCHRGPVHVLKMPQFPFMFGIRISGLSHLVWESAPWSFYSVLLFLVNYPADTLRCVALAKSGLLIVYAIRVGDRCLSPLSHLVNPLALP